MGLVNHRVFFVNASLGLYSQLLEDREAWKKKLGRSRLAASLPLKFRVSPQPLMLSRPAARAPERANP